MTDHTTNEIFTMAEKYFERLEIKNYSKETIKRRREHMKLFIAWCLDRDIVAPHQVTRNLLERYQRYLYRYRKEDNKPLSIRTQEQRLVTLKTFFKYLAQRHYLIYNPASELELPKQARRLPKNILTQEEAETIINIPNIHDLFGFRDRVILETLYSTGIRRTEIARLKLYDFDIERGTMLVREGKGKKDRMVPVGSRAAKWLEKYLNEVRPKLVMEPDDGHIFVTQLGTGFSPNAVGQLVRKYIKKAKIGKEGSCHLFRHTMATLMLENGADIRYIQEMLGHASLDTTQIYTKVSIKKLKEIHDATHPAKLERSKSIDDKGAIFSV